LVAIKVLRGGSTSDKRFVEKFTNNLVEQARIWLTFNNEHIMPFYGIALNCGYMPALVLPFYSRGNVVNYLRRVEVDDAGKLNLVADIARGINYLHGLKPPFIHGDIRGSNVLITDDGRAVLADYGLVFVIETTDFTSTKTAGTCRWMAPEVMNPADELLEDEEPPVLFTRASDIYAFGMTAFEILSGDVPFSNKKTDSSVIFYVLAGNRPDSPQYQKSTTQALRDFLALCWSTEPGRRPSAECVVKTLEKIIADIAQQGSAAGMFGLLRRAVRYFFSM
jgi:serine/threonine protein kinase